MTTKLTSIINQKLGANRRSLSEGCLGLHCDQAQIFILNIMKMQRRLSQILILFLFACCASRSLAKTAEPEKLRSNSPHSFQRVHLGGYAQTQVETLTFTEAEVNIENVDGSFQLTKRIVLNPGNNTLKFRISEIPAGAYFVRVNSEGNTKSFTMVVK
jgi:hypothetical protein